MLMWNAGLPNGKSKPIRSRMLLPEMNYDAACKSSMPDLGQAFTNFINRHPKHGGGYIAYGDFLLGHHDEDGALEQLEKGLKLDKTNANGLQRSCQHPMVTTDR